MISVRFLPLPVISHSHNISGLVSVSGDTASKLPDFTALSSQLAKVTPSGVNMASYTPTNTVARQCPTVGLDWQAASALPPTPNEELCSCMTKALTCVPKSILSSKDVGSLFGTVCGLGSGTCDGITANASTGHYGAYEMCNPVEKLGWALNNYYEKQQSAGNGASACDFKGAATTQAAVSPTGNCASLIQQAGSAGTGTVTSAPTGTGSSSGSGASGSSTHKGAAGITTVPSLDFGMLQLGAYLVCAMVAGAGMIIL